MSVTKADGITPAASSSVARRTAVQGIAGSLAGIAALGAVGASAKKKNKKTKGTLVRVELSLATETADPTEQPTVTALCDPPGGKETVFVLGGGFEFTSIDVIPLSALSVEDGDNVGYAVEARNTGGAEADITAQAICGYFRK